jgi:hypothetical protein
MSNMPRPRPPPPDYDRIKLYKIMQRCSVSDLKDVCASLGASDDAIVGEGHTAAKVAQAIIQFCNMRDRVSELIGCVRNLYSTDDWMHMVSATPFQFASPFAPRQKPKIAEAHKRLPPGLVSNPFRFSANKATPPVDWAKIIAAPTHAILVCSQPEDRHLVIRMLGDEFRHPESRNAFATFLSLEDYRTEEFSSQEGELNTTRCLFRMLSNHWIQFLCDLRGNYADVLREDGYPALDSMRLAHALWWGQAGNPEARIVEYSAPHLINPESILRQLKPHWEKLDAEVSKLDAEVSIDDVNRVVLESDQLQKAWSLRPVDCTRTYLLVEIEGDMATDAFGFSLIEALLAQADELARDNVFIKLFVPEKLPDLFGPLLQQAAIPQIPIHWSVSTLQAYWCEKLRGANRSYGAKKEKGAAPGSIETLTQLFNDATIGDNPLDFYMQLTTPASNQLDIDLVNLAGGSWQKLHQIGIDILDRYAESVKNLSPDIPPDTLIRLSLIHLPSNYLEAANISLDDAMDDWENYIASKLHNSRQTAR